MLERLLWFYIRFADVSCYTYAHKDGALSTGAVSGDTGVHFGVGVPYPSLFKDYHIKR